MPDSRPFTIAVLADFSARANAARGVELDADNLDSFLDWFRPRLELGLDFCGELELASAAQLHPDSLCARVYGLSALCEARAYAHDPRRAEQLAAQAGAKLALDSRAAEASAETPPPASAPASSVRSLLDDMLERRPSTDTDPVRRLARSLGSAAGDARDPAAVDRLRAAIDGELSRRLRALLCHPELRRIEGLCLGLRSLVREARDPERLRIRVVHATEDSLEAAASELRGAAILVAAHGFRLDEAGVSALRSLSRLASALGVGALAALGARALAPGDSTLRALEALRNSPAAARLGIVYPRVLARVAYGRSSEPIESFPFEELEGPAVPDRLVWCDGALAAARALARCVCATSGTRDLARFLSLHDLPIQVDSGARGSGVLGPTEIALHEREAEALLALGLDPLIALRDSDSARVGALCALDGSSLFPG